MGFIQKTNVPLSFQGGLQEKTDSIQLQPPGLLELQNACFNKLGQLNKRFGYDVFTTNVVGGATITSASAIDNYNNELNLFDNQSIYTYAAADGNWVNRGPAISLINSNNQIVRTSAAQQLNPDSAYLNGIEVYIWEDSRGSCRGSVIDAETSAYLISDLPIAGSLVKPKVVVFNGLFYIFYESNNNLYYRTLNPSNPSVVTNQVDLIADGYAGANFAYDVCVTNNKLFVIYQGDNTSGHDRPLWLFSLNTSNSMSSLTLIDTVVNNLGAVNVVPDSLNHLWISYGKTGTGLVTGAYNSSSLTVTMATTLVDGTVIPPNITGIESITPGVLQLTYEVPASSPSNQQVKTVIVQPPNSGTGVGTLTTIGTIRSVGLASKAFRYLNNLFVNVVHQSTLQSTYFQVFLTNSPFTIVGKVASQVGGGLRNNLLLPEVNIVTPGIYQWANLVKGQFISENNTNFSLLGVNSTKVDFTNVNKFNSVTQSNNLLFVGGILQSYDGTSVAEQNFHLFPEDIQATVFNTGGALSVGQYQYQVVYAWTDNFGQIQYSGPSTPITVTCTSPTSSVALVIPTLRLTAKTNVVIKVYRTPANGVLFNEVTSELAPLLNNPFADSVAFADVAADTQIAANALIYTTGGVLPNSAPPSCSLISLFQDRVIVSGLEDPNLLWFSKNKFNNTNFNTIPVEFSSQLTVAVPQLGGPITALGLMDDKLIIFKKNSILVMTGAGPNDEGGGEQFSAPELVTNSIGCNNPNSVVLSKDGIMFQSDKGIWLLDRGLGPPSYIGAGVDDEGKTYIISSAVVDPNDNLIIFTTYNGPAMVYDYYINQWSLYTNHQSIDAVVFNGLFVFCKPNGQVYSQNRSKFTDGPNFIQMEFVTPWMSFAGLQGYQRVFRAFLLGTFRGPHQLNVSVGFDFSPGFSQSAILNATSIVGNQWGSDGYWGTSSPWGSVYNPYEFQINFGRQRCTSLRLKVADSQTSPYNEGYSISSLSFEVGVLPDNNRLPLPNKVGTQ